MNRLSVDRQATIIRALVEGNSIRSVERMTNTHRDTIMRLGVRVGQACQDFSRQRLRPLRCDRIELDEIWCFVGKKQDHIPAGHDTSHVGDFWTWVAIDPDTKLVPSWVVGKRDARSAQRLMTDLRSRVINRVQLSSDALRLYVRAIEDTFGPGIDYGQIVKSYETDHIGPGRYSPPAVVSATRTPVFGDPDPDGISTSIVERQNLTMRMSIRRFTRLTNAFSKKVENLEAAVALHFAYYNFCRRHGTLRATPAMAAGVMDEPLPLRELVALAV